MALQQRVRLQAVQGLELELELELGLQPLQAQVAELDLKPQRLQVQDLLPQQVQVKAPGSPP